MLIDLKNVSYIYDAGAEDEAHALRHVSLEIKKGEIWGVIGHTGSGKSTLMEIMSGLLAPTDGEVFVEGENIGKMKNPVAYLKGRVGMVFQYPEHQLFEESVLEDVAFGPKNMGLDEREAKERASKAMRLVNLGEEYEALSPFELSGGEKRRAAIAGIIAMQPKVLILDEPTAGLDPAGCDSLLEMLKNIKGTLCESIVLVSHSMEDIAAFADKVLVLKRGEAILKGSVKEVFSQCDTLVEAGLDVPQITRLIAHLNEMGHDFDTDIVTIDEAVEAIAKKAACS